MDQNVATRACCIPSLKAMRLMVSEVKVTDSRSLTGRGRPWGLWAPSFLSVCMLVHDDPAQWAIPDLAPALAVFLPFLCLLGPAVVRGDADIVHFGEGSHPACDWAPSPFSPAACWEAPVDTTWKASVFYPQGTTRKPPLCCPPSREWQRTLLCDLIAPFPLLSQGAIHLRSVCTQC